MSVISILESTPNRVRALVRLSAIVGPSSRATLRDYFMPGGDSGGQFNNLIRETIRLGFLVEQSSEVALGPDIESKNVVNDEWFLEFLDRQLVINPPEDGDNRVFRYALAWLLGQPAGAAISWTAEQHIKMREQMDGDDCYDVTNGSRFAMLCYWARYLGYACGLSIGGGSAVVPDPTEAMARRLRLFAGSSRLPISRFFDDAARDCPVLESGAIRRAVEGRFKVKRAGNVLSHSTALALWRLENRGSVRLVHASDSETWLMPIDTVSAGAGGVRRITHVEITGARV